MTPSSDKVLLELAERLQKRAEQERQIVANSTIVANLLQPEVDRWEAKAASNLYAVRMAVDHFQSAKRDAAFAADLEQAIAFIRSSTTSDMGAK